MRFSGVARLQIMAILNHDSAKGKMLDPEFQKTMKLYEKIYIPDDVQENELSVKDKETGLSTGMLDPQKVKGMKVLDVELEHNELTKLEDRLKAFDFMPAQIQLWVADVMAQLEEAKKPKMESEAERQKTLSEHRAQNRPKVVGRTG